MFEILLILYVVFNVLAMFILATCCVCTIIANTRINKLATAKIALPTFSDCKSTFIKCCVVSSLLIILDWILYSSGYVSEKKISGGVILSEVTLKFAFTWAICLAVLSLIEIIIKFSKTRSHQIKDAINPVIVRTIWCFLLTFIIT